MEKLKKEMANLKRQRTKLLNKECETMEQFEETQNKLNYIEAEMRNIMQAL